MSETSTDILSGPLDEAHRQLTICNACRYCEGYCAAFKALSRHRDFALGDIVHLANLCHDCRGCYYSCQYAPPHDFAVNLPQALAEVRRDSWERHQPPTALARTLQRSGWAAWAAVALSCALIALAVATVPANGGRGFYGLLPHGAMVTIFLAAVLVPLVGLALGLRSCWREIGGARVRWVHLRAALSQAVRLSNLTGGHGEGCNFERRERFSLARRRAHHLVLWGFLLCLASTASGTILHYVFAMPAPYPALSLPKLFGVPGGVMLLVGALWMLALRDQADRAPGDRLARFAGATFVLLLALVSASGLALYFLGGGAALGPLLVLHLGAVLALFLITPYTKMAHAAYRAAALVREQQLQETGT